MRQTCGPQQQHATLSSARASASSLSEASNVYLSRHRIDQLWGLRKANFTGAVNFASFTNDLWVAAAPEVLETWNEISQQFDFYEGEIRRRLAQYK